MIDIGANLASPAFDEDRDEVVRRAVAASVATMIVTGTSVASSRAAIALAADDAQTRVSSGVLYATAGVHPHEASTVAAGWETEIAALATDSNVVAIGETGLDYYRDYARRDDQRTVFRRQAELAVDTGKPLFVHDRDSEGETRRILADYRHDLTACVVHCFTGTANELDGYLADGYSIGITGWICDERRGGELMGLVPRIPAERLMIETDAPYLLPRTIVPKPRSRRNEPAFLPWVARRVAECRGVEPAAVERQTHRNAARFFGLPET